MRRSLENANATKMWPHNPGSHWRWGGGTELINIKTSAGSIPGFVRYRLIPEFCSILDTYVVSLIFT